MSQEHKVYMRQLNPRNEFPTNGLVLITGHKNTGKTTMAWTMAYFVRSLGGMNPRPVMCVGKTWDPATTAPPSNDYQMWEYASASWNEKCEDILDSWISEKGGEPIVIIDDISTIDDIMSDRMKMFMGQAKSTNTLFLVCVDMPVMTDDYAKIVDMTILLKCDPEEDGGILRDITHQLWFHHCIGHIMAFGDLIKHVTHNPAGYCALVYNNKHQDVSQRLTFFRTNPNSFQFKMVPDKSEMARTL